MFVPWEDPFGCRVEDGLKEERLCPHGKTVETVQVRDDGGLNLSEDSGEWRKSRQIQEVLQELYFQQDMRSEGKKNRTGYFHWVEVRAEVRDRGSV